MALFNLTVNDTLRIIKSLDERLDRTKKNSGEKKLARRSEIKNKQPGDVKRTE